MRSRPGIKSMIYVQSNIKKIRKSTEGGESLSAAIAASTKEEDFVDKVPPAMSPPFCEEGKTAMKKFFEAMVSVCFFYDVEFRNLCLEQELGIGKELLERVN